jgi:hypothetical protein
MSTIRQQIIDAVTARLEGILPSGVYPWRKVPFSKAQVPAIAFWDTESILGEGTMQSFAHRLTVTVIGVFAASATMDDARSRQGEILAAIGSDMTWGGLAAWTEVTAQDVSLQQAGDIVTGCELILTIVYYTDLWSI